MNRKLGAALVVLNAILAASWGLTWATKHAHAQGGQAPVQQDPNAPVPVPAPVQAPPAAPEPEPETPAPQPPMEINDSGATADYSMIAGKTQGLTSQTVYVTDTQSLTMLAITYDFPAKALKILGMRNLKSDLEAQQKELQRQQARTPRRTVRE